MTELWMSDEPPPDMCGHCQPPHGVGQHETEFFSAVVDGVGFGLLCCDCVCDLPVEVGA